MQSRSTSHIRGIDISHWDGEIDFAKVKASGIKVVYIKATEGTKYVDPMLETYYKGALARGLDIGFYHFFRPVSEADTLKQVEHFLNAIQGKQYKCRLAIDLETNDNKLSKQVVTKLAILFLDEVKKRTGKTDILYTYTSFTKENLTKDLTNYKVWIAQYEVNQPADNGVWADWTGFQYSEKGTVSGINGQCDLNEFMPQIYIGIQ